ncbi:SusC/RagA family TonB-linked outer membrane protein [Pedobacter mucosus]|uniref:SusC/RagA family TonB-linked outer membrane protein n=1 Tax=Pedobacter mucosus TaxID=2895286 RepID=UPI001EE49CC1|nr:TonB-dependent receptor [Pedobacter mucosus]UKT64924.1 TonB-dependent receptor [Pedobacter mucosus]
MKKFLLLLIFPFLIVQFTKAQTRVLKGKITDVRSGETLPGVNISINNGPRVISDTNGNYSINLPANNSGTISASFIGYQTKTTTIGTQTQINFALTSSIEDLNDVVVVGYGVIKKPDVTGSIAQVNIADMLKAPVKSFDDALAGRVAGVTVSSNDGQPGSTNNIVIRGNNSVTQDNTPLYVIDGFPIDNPDNNIINPEEIESITILKDASSTAIYGSRGANGVILITTKRGKIGDPVVKLNSYVAVQDVTHRENMMDPYEFVRLQNDIDPVSTALVYFADGKTLESYRGVPGVDFQDALYRQAFMHSNNLSISGGTEKTRYSISASVVGQGGVIINSDFGRYQGRVTLDQDVNAKLKVGINANYSSINITGTTPSSSTAQINASTNLMYSVWGYRPISSGNIDLLNELFDPEIDETVNYRFNPIASANNEYRRNVTNNIIANVYADYAITPKLKLRVTGGLNNNQNRSESFNNTQTRSGSPFGPLGVNGVNGGIAYRQVNNWVNENTLTYNNNFNKNNSLNVLVGGTLQGINATSYGYTATAVPNENLGISGLDEGLPRSITSSQTGSKLASGLARVNYNFMSKYLFTATVRADGSSKFRENNKWSYFTSGAFAWRMSDEPFMKKLKFINDAKLRISYGETGNNRIGDFSTYSTFIIEPMAAYAFNNSIIKGIIPSAIGNPGLKWETTATTNIGYDLSMFNDRIGITIDAYRKTTFDLLLNALLPTTTGYANAFKNIGRVRNQGLEITINTVNIKNKNFSWSTNFNISFNQNKLMGLAENQESIQTPIVWDRRYTGLPVYVAKLDNPISQMYGFVWDGIYQFEDFDKLPDGRYTLKANVVNNGSARTAVQPGDIKYKDINGDGVVNTLDQTQIGRAYPIHVGGLSNNISYKNFDLNFFLQWSYGNDIINANRLIFEGNSSASINLNQYAEYADRWTPTNPSNTLHRVGGQGPAYYSSRIIEDGSYIRLKTVALGYNFGKQVLQSIKIKALRAYVSGQNLYTITGYSGPDPEVSVKNSTLTPGFDYSAYPRARTITFGINATF